MMKPEVEIFESQSLVGTEQFNDLVISALVHAFTGYTDHSQALGSRLKKS